MHIPRRQNSRAKGVFIARRLDILLDNVLKTKEKETIKTSEKTTECQDNILKKDSTGEALMKNLFVRKDI